MPTDELSAARSIVHSHHKVFTVLTVWHMWYFEDRDISCSADSNDEATQQEELAMLVWVNVYWLNSAARNRAADRDACSSSSL